MPKSPFLLLFSVIIFCSCKKSNSAPSDNPTPPATLLFECNGKSYEFDGDFTSGNPKGSKIERMTIWEAFSGYVRAYCLIGSNGLPMSDSNYFAIVIPITTDSIWQVGYFGGNLYEATGALGLNQYANQYGPGGGDNYRLNFIGVTNQEASGTFSATLSPVDTSLHVPILTITDGKFLNVKIIR